MYWRKMKIWHDGQQSHFFSKCTKLHVDIQKFSRYRAGREWRGKGRIGREMTRTPRFPGRSLPSSIVVPCLNCCRSCGTLLYWHNSVLSFSCHIVDHWLREEVSTADYFGCKTDGQIMKLHVLQTASLYHLLVICFAMLTVFTAYSVCL